MVPDRAPPRPAVDPGCSSDPTCERERTSGTERADQNSCRGSPEGHRSHDDCHVEGEYAALERSWSACIEETPHRNALEPVTEATDRVRDERDPEHRGHCSCSDSQSGHHGTQEYSRDQTVL